MGRYAPVAFLAGVGLLLVGLGFVAQGAPAYTTEVAAEAADVDNLTADSEYTPTDVDPIPLETLSPAERSTIREARQAPDRTAVERFAPGDGPTLDYRNDVVTEYVVADDDGVAVVRVLLDVDYVSLALGALSAILGALLLLGGVWNARAD